jgi:hypothetical protein
VTGGDPRPATLEDARSFTVEGPVQAEILVVVLDADRPALTGPCGPEPWYVEIPQGDDPMAVTARLLHANVGAPVVLHSTSWRTSRGGVVLTFVAVVDPAAVASLTQEGAVVASPRASSTRPTGTRSSARSHPAGRRH